MEKLFGLPAHPLMVHAPVVLLPLTVLLVLVYAVRPGWRERYGWTMVVAAGAAFVTSMSAKLSGEALLEALPFSPAADLMDPHEQFANRTVLFVFLLLIAAVVGAVQDFRYRRSGSEASNTAGHVAMAVTVVLCLIATYWMIKTGHAGARLSHEGKI